MARTEPLLAGITELLGKGRAFLAQPEVRQALAFYLVMRLWVSAVAAAAVLFLGVPTEPDPILHPYLGQEPITPGWEGVLLGPWQRFDTLWYTKIAMEGYGADVRSTVFPPLYPLLIRLVAPLLGGNYLLAALAISNLAEIGALVAFQRWAAMHADPDTARRSVLYLISFPTAFFLVAGYTQSLFLLLVILGFLAAREERWPLAGIWGGLATLTRLEGGVVLLVSFAYLYLEKRGFRISEVKREILWLGPILLGNAVTILVPVWAVGGFHEWREIVAIWDRSLIFPWVSVWEAFKAVLAWPIRWLFLLDLASAIGFLLLAFWAFRHLPKVYSIYMGVSLLAFLSFFHPTLPLISMTRHMLHLFPGFIGLASLASRQGSQRVVLTSFLLLQTYLLSLFAIWEWVG